MRITQKNLFTTFIVLILFEFVKTLNKMRHEPYPRHDLIDSVSKEIRAKSRGMLLPVEDEGKMIWFIGLELLQLFKYFQLVSSWEFPTMNGGGCM